MPLPLPIELETLLRLLVGGAVLFYLWPRYAFAPVPAVNPLDRSVGYAVRMLVLLIFGGYALAAAHIYGWLTLALLVCSPALLRARRPRSDYALRPELRLAARLLAALDQLGSVPERLWSRLRSHGSRLRRSRAGRLTLYGAAGGLLFLLVLAVSAWMRLASPFAHAAIPFSDSDVVLYWVQAIERQRLFPSGIYLEGFHLTMATLIRLTAANPIVTVKFFGPIVGVLMVVSVGFAAYRLTGRIAPAILAVLVYGTLPHLLPYASLRQVGTDSQEFGNVFVLPALYFAYASWVQEDGFYRGTAAALLLAAALIHPVVTLNAVLAAAAATAAAWLATGIRRPTLVWYLRWLSLAALASLVPVVIALAVGVPFNSSGVAFAAAVSAAPAPPVAPVALVALGSATALILVRLLRLRLGRCGRAEAGLALAGLLTLLSALAVQQAPRFGIHSVVLTTRSGEFLALAEALALGLGLSALQELVELAHAGSGRWLALAAAAAAAAFAWLPLGPAPLNPFPTARWLPDDFVAAYVEIGASLPRDSWLAVSDDSGFDYSFGQSDFMTGSDFLEHVGTAAPWPTYRTGRDVRPLPEDHIFLFVDRRTVVAPGYRYAVVARRRAAQTAIRTWIAAWQRRHPPLKVFFRGPDLTVYELTRPDRGTFGDFGP